MGEFSHRITLCCIWCCFFASLDQFIQVHSNFRKWLLVLQKLWSDSTYYYSLNISGASTFLVAKVKRWCRETNAQEIWAYSDVSPIKTSEILVRWIHGSGKVRNHFSLKLWALKVVFVLCNISCQTIAKWLLLCTCKTDKCWQCSAELLFSFTLTKSVSG